MIFFEKNVTAIKIGSNRFKLNKNNINYTPFLLLNYNINFFILIYQKGGKIVTFLYNF
jgi:hypothetical protein